MDPETTLTLKQAAERVGVTPATLKRWAESGVIPNLNGSREWPPAAVSHARIVARMRERGHSLQHIREAGAQGRLAYGFIEELFADERAAPHARRGGRAHGPRAGADRALLGRHRPARRRASST